MAIQLSWGKPLQPWQAPAAAVRCTWATPKSRQPLHAVAWHDGTTDDARPLPTVDWRRRSQRILFVDRSDTARSRFALGMLERLAAWHGCSSTSSSQGSVRQVLVGEHCGLEAAPGTRLAFEAQAALFCLAAPWQLQPHLFTRPRQRFEPEDVDRFDLLVCLDAATQAGVLMRLSAARPTESPAFVQRVCCLSDFLTALSDEQLLLEQRCGDGGGGGGGQAAALDPDLRRRVGAALRGLRPSAAVVAAAAAAAATGPATAAIPTYLLPSGIPRPALHSEDGGGGGAADDWERLALLLAVCIAGLTRYLLQGAPSDPDE